VEEAEVPPEAAAGAAALGFWAKERTGRAVWCPAVVVEVDPEAVTAPHHLTTMGLLALCMGVEGVARTKMPPEAAQVARAAKVLCVSFGAQGALSRQLM
jgi:hypothetical protein